MEWVRTSIEARLERTNLPLREDAQRETWTFLKAVGLVEANGTPIGRSALQKATAQCDIEHLRGIILKFEPVVRIVAALNAGAATVAEVKRATDLGDRTFGAALMLAVASGIVWRAHDDLGPGTGFVDRDAFRTWLVGAVVPPIRISTVAQAATSTLRLSVPRFRDALKVTIGDPVFAGTKGGSTEDHPLDCKSLDIAEDGRITVEELQVDNLLGLRSLTVRS
jgi:hypothetical protein